MGNVTAVPLRFFFAPGYDDTTKWHMTTDDPEINAMTYGGENPDWTEEGPGLGEHVYVFNQPVVGTVPLYRYLNKLSGDHFFTASEEEGNRAIAKYDCAPEGISCYLSPTQVPGTIPLYRLLINNKYHHYLTNAFERANQMAGRATSFLDININGPAEDEGITGFVWTSPVSLPAQ